MGPVFKHLKGVNRAKWEKMAGGMVRDYVRPTYLEPSDEIVLKLGTLMAEADFLHCRLRARSDKETVPTWPLHWTSGGSGEPYCTGEALSLYRVWSDKKQGSPNYGKFYVCKRVELVKEKEGRWEPVLDDAGNPRSDLQNFCWFGRCEFVSQGGFETIFGRHKVLKKLLLDTHGPQLTPQALWPSVLGSVIDHVEVTVAELRKKLDETAEEVPETEPDGDTEGEVEEDEEPVTNGVSELIQQANAEMAGDRVG